MTSTGRGWAYAWDAENRMKSATGATQSLEFKYDYMSRRVEKKVTESGSVTKYLRFVYDGYKLIEELDAADSNAIKKKIVWSGDTPISIYDTALDATYYYVLDGNKNVSELLDSSGNVVAHYEYDSFGKIIAQSGSYADENPIRFSSEYFDSETGLVYYNYRYYNPDLGRWLSKDPIAEKGGYNLYGMLANEPISDIDYLGLDPLNKRKQDSQYFSDYEAALQTFLMDRGIDRCQAARKAIENAEYLQAERNAKECETGLWDNFKDFASDLLRDTRDFAAAAVSAFANDLAMDIPASTGAYSERGFNDAQRYGAGLGHATAMVGGLYEATFGGGMAIGGGAVTVFSGGTASAVSVPAVVGGGAMVTHGTGASITATRNLISTMMSSSTGGSTGEIKASPPGNNTQCKKSKLKYDQTQSKKHKKGGQGTEMDLDDATAQDVLDNSIQAGKQRYGLHDGKIYEFQPDNVGGYHGYPIRGDKTPNSILKQLRNDGRISKAEYKKLVKGEE